MRFLADESCDFIVVTALRAVGHDVSAIVEINPGAEDEGVLALTRSETRILLTEDKDFGLLAYAIRHETAGVVLIRFPARARSALGQSIVDVVAELGARIAGAFVVIAGGPCGCVEQTEPCLHSRLQFRPTLDAVADAGERTSPLVESA